MSRFLLVAVAIVVTPGCWSDETGTTSPVGERTARPVPLVSALVDDSVWTSSVVTVRTGGGLMGIVATGWNGEDRQHLSLIFETTVGSTPQTIGSGRPPFASINFEFVAAWLASGDVGSGTISLTSLTANRATGTFTFTGAASPTSALPAVRVVRHGMFDVPLR